MDEPTESWSTGAGARWGHLRWLLLLVVLAAGLRFWQVRHTEVTTRDSIAFIRYAWRLQSESWPEVIRTENHHPVYPFLIHLAGAPVRALVPDDLPRAMQLAAQLVSCLAGVLLVVPMYWLGCELFGRRVGFWATLLFQCLPGPGRVLADGLTESVFLLLCASGLYFACRAVRAGGVGWFVLTGLTSGLAYLTRTEGLLVAAVTGAVLAGLQVGRAWRRDGWAFGRAGLALTTATLVVAGPFMWHIGGVSLKPSQYNFFGKPWQSRSTVPVSEGPAPIAHTPLPLAMWEYNSTARPEDRYFWAVRALVAMVDKGFFHVLTLPFLAGLFLLRQRATRVPGAWVLLALGAVLVALLYRLGQSNGYLGERHVLLIVMGGLYGAVAALGVLCDWVARRVGGLSGSTLTLLVLAGLTLLPLPKTLAPLHAERAGFRQAGRWLAEHVRPGDRVVDPFTWASYHAGLDFRHDPQGAPSGSSVCYVVLDRSRSKHEHLWYLVGPAEELARQGVEVRRFPVKVGKYRGTVIVYRARL